MGLGLIDHLALVVVASMSSLFGACASTPALTGAMCPKRAVVFGEVGSVPRWTLADGPGAVLVVFTEDGATANEELVLALPSADAGELAIGDASEHYYQRGGQILTYASRSLSGRVRMTKSGDRMKGSADVVVTHPEVDVEKVGEVRRDLRFDVAIDPPMCR